MGNAGAAEAVVSNTSNAWRATRWRTLARGSSALLLSQYSADLVVCHFAMNLGSIIAWDEAVSDRIHRFFSRNQLLQSSLNVLSNSLETLLSLGTLSLCLTVVLLPNPIDLLLPLWEHRFLRRLVVFAMAAFAIELLIKRFVRRRRPQACSKHSVSGEHFSFPSGHSMRAFMAATLYLNETSASRGAIGLWAASIAFGRLASSHHFLLDVVSGAALGIGLAAALIWTNAPAALSFL